MSVTLHYYNGYGLGEVIRMILHSQNIQFTDDRFEDEGAEAFLKSGKAEFDQVPCLEIDGHNLVESRAVERYLLTRAGVHTSSNYEGYLNDSTVSFLDDIRRMMAKFIYIDNNLEGLAKWCQTDLPWYLQKLNARINEHYYFVGSSPQHADWAVFEFFWDHFLSPSRAEKGRPLFAGSPKLLEFIERFKARDQRLSDYLDSRPNSDH